MKPCEKIGRDAGIGYYPSDSVYPIKIPFPGVFTVHILENRIASTLHREMDMMGYIGIFCNSLNYLITHILGMGGGETDSHIRGSQRHNREKFRKIRDFSIRPYVPITVDILAQQSHFLETTLP